MGIDSETVIPPQNISQSFYKYIKARTLKIAYYKIIPALQPYIRSVSTIENAGGSSSSCTFRVIPDTCVEIYFAYNGQPIATIGTKTQFDSSRSFISSRMKAYMDVQLPQNCGTIAVCFHPGVAFRFFNLPMKELTDNNILLSDIWGNKINELEENISVFSSHEERVMAVQTFILNLIQQEPDNKNAYEYCLGQINLFKGHMSLKVLSQKTNMSQRQMGRHFNTFLGLSPKEFSRITRFLWSMENSQKNPAKSFTQIAYECGYFDQAHFIRDCKEFTGMTPKELANAKVAICPVSFFNNSQ